MKQKSHQIELYTNDFPKIYESFFMITGLDYTLRNLSKKHPFYEALHYYVNNKHDLTNEALLPLGQKYYETTNHLVNIAYLKKTYHNKKSTKLFLSKDMIDSICVEALAIVEYLKRGYGISWLTPIGEDPPDFIVFDIINNSYVNFEVKCKVVETNIESLFSAFSKGAKDLRKSKIIGRNPSVVIVHNPKDLGWIKWLDDDKVKREFEQRLRNKEYAMISGVIFSGGTESKVGKNIRQRGYKNVAFRFNNALHPLPYGFLNKSGKI